MTVPECAPGCPIVAYLIAEIARLKGTSEAVQRVTHGLDTDE